MMSSSSRPTTLITVGNLPHRTRFTFANSIRGAKLKYRGSRSIIRVVVLDTLKTIGTSDDRSFVIRDILGQECSIESVPCLTDFPARAFGVIATELLRPDFDPPIVDITNGRRFETFSLIVATSLVRVADVIFTDMAPENFSTEYHLLGDEEYKVITVDSFSNHRALESAARFELIYYSDRIDSICTGLEASDVFTPMVSLCERVMP